MAITVGPNTDVCEVCGSPATQFVVDMHEDSPTAGRDATGKLWCTWKEPQPQDKHAFCDIHVRQACEYLLHKKEPTMNTPRQDAEAYVVELKKVLSAPFGTNSTDQELDDKIAARWEYVVSTLTALIEQHRKQAAILAAAGPVTVNYNDTPVYGVSSMRAGYKTYRQILEAVKVDQLSRYEDNTSLGSNGQLVADVYSDSDTQYEMTQFTSKGPQQVVVDPNRVHVVWDEPAGVDPQVYEAVADYAARMEATIAPKPPTREVIDTYETTVATPCTIRHTFEGGVCAKCGAKEFV